MDLFNVYSQFDLEIVKGEDCSVWDSKGEEYLDLYGGHAVISVGHSHPNYIKAVKDQIEKLGFYSNAVKNGLQLKLANKLGELSGYEEYSLFLVNSGAEANENALKLASFHTGRDSVVAFKKAFHGRTSLAVEATDNPSIVAPINANNRVTHLPYNDINAVSSFFSTHKPAAVLIEPIQGVGGVEVASDEFLEGVRALCDQHEVLLIFDEIQCGYGRSGKFFAHQYSGVKPDLITVAKGIANGFPMGGVLIAPHLRPKLGMLGTTFGGNHLACAAAISVLEIFEQEELVKNAEHVGNFLIQELKKIPQLVEVRGRGLMIGVEFSTPIKELRNRLLYKEHIFTGVSGDKVLRILPPLTLNINKSKLFIDALVRNL